MGRVEGLIGVGDCIFIVVLICIIVLFYLIILYEYRSIRDSWLDQSFLGLVQLMGQRVRELSLYGNILGSLG